MENCGSVLSIESQRDEKRIPGAFTGWDNTPRKGKHGLVVNNASPELFHQYFSKQIRRAKEVYHKDMIFVAAWNEWARRFYA